MASKFLQLLTALIVAVAVMLVVFTTYGAVAHVQHPPAGIAQR